MAETFTWPEALRPASVEWELIVPQQQGRSAFDGSVQAQMLGPPRWAFTITTGVVRLSEAPRWEAFIQRLRGQVNRVMAWDWRREAPLGPATGTPTVAAQNLGNTLVVDGWTPSTTGVLLAGSWLRVYGELKRLSVDANSDATGRAVLIFEPPLRAAPEVGSALVLAKATAKFMLTNERQSMKQEGSRVLGASYTFEEDVAP